MHATHLLLYPIQMKFLCIKHKHAQYFLKDLIVQIISVNLLQLSYLQHALT